MTGAIFTGTRLAMDHEPLTIGRKYLKDTLRLPGSGTLGVDEKLCCVSAVLSTPDIDADGDSVIPEGAILSRHRLNPVVCLNHARTALPIGKAETPDGRYTVVIEPGRRITAKTFFDQNNATSMEVFGLYASGLLRGWSLGFMPLSIEPMGMRSDNRRPGQIIKSYEVIEYSAVTIPCNRETLTAKLDKGLSVGVDPVLMQALESHRLPKRVLANGWTPAKDKNMDDTRELQAVILPLSDFPESHQGHDWLKAKSYNPLEIKSVESSSFCAGGPCTQFVIKAMSEFDPEDAGEVREIGDGAKALYFRPKQKPMDQQLVVESPVTGPAVPLADDIKAMAKSMAELVLGDIMKQFSESLKAESQKAIALYEASIKTKAFDPPRTEKTAPAPVNVPVAPVWLKDLESLNDNTKALHDEFYRLTGKRLA